MPTILALKKDNVICIGSDSLHILGGSRKQSAEYLAHSEKIIQYQSNYIGVLSNSSLYLAIKDYLSGSKKKHFFRNIEEIFNELRLIHKVLREEYYLLPEQSTDESFESSKFELLIINKHGIFKTYELRSVQAFTRFYAIGTGASYALGAMEALYDKNHSAEVITKLALEISAEFDDSTGLPGYFHTIKV